MADCGLLASCVGLSCDLKTDSGAEQVRNYLQAEPHTEHSAGEARGHLTRSAVHP